MTATPLLIGKVRVAPPVLLAPMAGYTDAAFRILCRRMGCGMAFTEVANAEALLRGSLRTFHLLETVEGERPIAAHLYGSQPDVLARAAALVEKLGRFDVIDVNAGCPVRKIVAKGAGAALMSTPERIGEIIRAIRGAVSLPVTVKTRIGLTPDRNLASELAHAAEEGGAAAIAIHGRFASRQHKGEADWETLARVKRERRIPVIGNGGIQSARDVAAMMERTGVDGVMIGRGAVGNPWIFRESASLLNGEPVLSHGREEHRAMVAEHLERLIALKAKERKYRRRHSLEVEQAATMQFRAHLLRYVVGLDGAAAVRKRLEAMRSAQDVMDAVDAVLGLRPAGVAWAGEAHCTEDVLPKE